jgi:hypothetical protein
MAISYNLFNDYVNYIIIIINNYNTIQIYLNLKFKHFGHWQQGQSRFQKC